MAKPRTRVVIATPARVRVLGKRCAAPECRHRVRPGYRYCGYHGGKILEALHASREFWTHDLRWNSETRAWHASPTAD